ncbi:MAG: hypothetical protein Q9163_003575 [Psora crenata]
MSAATPGYSERPYVDESTYFNAGHRTRRKPHESSGDSGTEADDEKGAFLLELPAPPARPRKGLKESSGATSPLLTPSYLDDDHRKAMAEAWTRAPTSFHGHSSDREAVKLREKFVKRRRAELMRRTTEIILALAVCYIALRDCLPRPSFRPSSVGVSPGSLLIDFGLKGLPKAVIHYMAIVFGLYALYPLRIIKQNHDNNATQHRSWFYIHLPAAFDPAPLLYPVLIPIVVAWSVKPANPHVLLPNVVLSIASIPSKIIPLGGLPWYGSLQWLLSILPIMNTTPVSTNRCLGIDPKEWPSLNDIESLLLLYPLHQTLLPILQYLTTTSLLPAELQLLSVSMINLLAMSTSPQALILKGLLWLGGVLVLVTCSKVVRLAVALARIPSWRFRRPRRRSRRNGVIHGAIDIDFTRSLSRWELILQASDSSDSEVGFPRVAKGRSPNPQTLKVRTCAVERPAELAPPSQVPKVPMLVTNLDKPSEPVHGNSSTAGGKRLRRNTVPTCTRTSANDPLQVHLKQVGSRILHNSKSWSLRCLTASQAMVLRWLFALYVYIIVVAIIALPVRLYVRRVALGGHEPLGWALGYLFGDMARFKSFVDDWNLRMWIYVPPRTRDHTILTRPATSAYVFCTYLGLANTRLLICVYCLSVIAAGLTVVLRLSAVVEVDTRRKVFHGMMVAMFLPTIFVDPTFVSLALILVLAIFLLLDLFRASQLPPVSKPLTYFLAPYVDGRDHRGPVIVSPIFLLIGCAIPLWLSLAATPLNGKAHWHGWEVEERDLSMVAGVVCVGIGDAAASLIGRRYGRHPWCWSGGKSLEGSLAFAVGVVCGLSAARLWLLVGGWVGDSGDSVPVFLTKAIVAASGASLTEAVLTGGNDNVIVPVTLWLLVRGLRM